MIVDLFTRDNTFPFRTVCRTRPTTNCILGMKKPFYLIKLAEKGLFCSIRDVSVKAELWTFEFFLDASQVVFRRVSKSTRVVIDPLFAKWRSNLPKVFPGCDKNN